MKSDLPKMLHPLLGRTLVGHVLAAAAPLGAERTLVVVGQRRRPGHRAPGRDRAGRARPCCRPAARHRARGADRDRGAPASWTAPWWCSTATCRCCGRRRCSDAGRGARGGRRGGDRAGRRGARPDRPGPDRPRRRRRAVARSSRSATPTPEQRAIREINAGHLRLRRGRAAGRARQAHHRQRPGRGVPHRRLRAARDAGRAGARCTLAGDADRDAGLQRPGRAGRRCGRCCATGSTRPGCAPG